MSNNNHAALVWGKNKTKVVEAYRAYEKRAPGSLDHLFAVLRDFAYTKLYHLEYDFKDFGTAETADDWAQDVCLNIWKKLDSFEGTPEAFFSWVHKIAFNQASAAFNYLDEEKSTKVPLFVQMEDEVNGEQFYFETNPEVVFNAIRPDTSIHIPAWIEGKDKTILNLMLSGYNQKQIGAIMRVSEFVIHRRLKKLRQEVERRHKKGLTKNGKPPDAPPADKV